MKKQKIYYAHHLAIFDKPQESRDIGTLMALGFEVVSPNCPECAAGYKAGGMDFFKTFTADCDAIAFRGLPDGSIPAGVAKEIENFVLASKPVIELPSRRLQRVLTVEQTREFLSECGQR